LYIFIILFNAACSEVFAAVVCGIYLSSAVQHWRFGYDAVEIILLKIQ